MLRITKFEERQKKRIKEKQKTETYIDCLGMEWIKIKKKRER